MILQYTRHITIMLTIACLLLIPFKAMQFSNEVNWSVFDFIAAAGLLFGTGLVCELVIRKVKTIKYRIAVCGRVLLALILIWMELAVGIFGTHFAGRYRKGFERKQKITVAIKIRSVAATIYNIP